MSLGFREVMPQYFERQFCVCAIHREQPLAELQSRSLLRTRYSWSTARENCTYEER